MRELKFKAWDKDSKKWSNTPMKYAIDDINFYTDYEWCQYTGLKDKEGNDIYEGDILKFSWFIDDEFLFESVSFSEGSYLVGDFKLRNIWHKAEIVGNIYQNKELLEVK